MAGLAVFLPKCGLCLLGYAGLGAALGLVRPELCGAAASPSASWLWLPAAGVTLGWLALRRRGT